MKLLSRFIISASASKAQSIPTWSWCNHFLWASGVLQCLTRRLGMLLVFHLTIMNVYVDTLALLHIIWQDIKDQMARLAVVASRVKQPQKSTLIVQRPLRAHSAKVGYELCHVLCAKFETSVHLHSSQSTTINSYIIFSLFYMI